jgi:hypothetical protein
MDYRQPGPNPPKGTELWLGWTGHMVDRRTDNMSVQQRLRGLILILNFR